MKEFELDYDVDPVEVIADVRDKWVERDHPEIACLWVAACVALAVVAAVAVWHVAAVHVWAGIETVVGAVLVKTVTVGP
jgi:hypothetical protein